MNCIIDKSITYHLKKGKKAEVIRRYIKMKYRVNMDLKTLKERVKNLQHSQLELT